MAGTVVLIVGVAMFGVPRLQHRGEHYVPGSSASTVTIALDQDNLAPEGEDASPTCYYDSAWPSAEGGRVIVPFTVTGPSDGGAVTVQVDARVANLPDGFDGAEFDGGDGTVVAAGTRVFPLQTAMGWGIVVAMSHAAWAAGANDCVLSVESTPGAWFPNDD